ncbi:efflux RND transporter periplasmic adaptor subunit [Singulisphaera sp. PoT]|uniref:efflux RND transporter periplasmic adaptor subunit n=1 Tax=Singulisphaera sp. PoT TaxID=3411797 RepID=UPI003BF4F0E5
MQLGAAALVGGGVVAVGAIWYVNRLEKDKPEPAPSSELMAQSKAAPEPPPAAEVKVEPVQLNPEQQKAIGLMTAKASLGVSYDVLAAPGRVAPNESQYAFITPRASGVVRSVTARVGQDVKAGDLLATIDSPEVGTARLDLYTKQQSLDIAKAQAGWQERIHATTLELIRRLQKGETPEQIHNAFSERPVGENREKLMTAYAQYRLGIATMDRNKDLFAQKLITPKQFDQVKADYEVAQAGYQSLMDQMGYETMLANTRAKQALQQAETAVRAARERLRILGVKPDGSEPQIAGGKIVGLAKDGALPDSAADDQPESDKSGAILPSQREFGALAGAPPSVPGTDPSTKDAPVSTYCIWAPFDGTVLDREMIVPGVAVDTTHRIFTMANLKTVWVEANVHEGDFNMLVRSKKGKVRFRSPAYPNHTFDGEVIYTGDLVEEQSRSLKLLARASNPERLLKPGMFVEVEVLIPRESTAVNIPASALLTEGNRSFVYVQIGPDRFERREVGAEAPRGDMVLIHDGLKVGDQVVTEGGYKLKSMAVQIASSAN